MSQRFFRTLRKFNVLTFSVLSLIGIFIATYLAYEIGRDIFRSKYHIAGAARVSAKTPAGTQDGNETKTDLDVQNFVPIHGTNILYSQLIARQTYDYRFSSKQASSVRNWIFFDMASGTSRKLLPDDDRVIIESRELRPQSTARNLPPKALLFAIVDSDSNGDGMMNGRDGRALALSHIDGTGLTRLDDLKGSPRGEFVNEDGTELILITEQDETLSAHTVDLTNFTVTGTKPIVR